MSFSHIALKDNIYDRIKHSLTNGKRFVMAPASANVRMKVELQDGFMMGLFKGQWVPVINETTAMNTAMAKPDENHIRIDIKSLKGSKKNAHTYLDNITMLAHEKGFPLYAVDFANEPGGPSDSHVLGVTLKMFNEIIDIYRTSADDGTWLTPYEKLKETMESKLADLLDCYRNYTKSKSNHEPEIHRTMMCFMRLELEFFLKFKNYTDCQGFKCTRSECEALMKDIREEYPLAMFNEVLMEIFDANMAFSEGNVKSAGDMVKAKYDELQRWHAQLGDKNLH
jgi:hypothetical protein